jgi:hypothetical protein
MGLRKHLGGATTLTPRASSKMESLCAIDKLHGMLGAAGLYTTSGQPGPSFKSRYRGSVARKRRPMMVHNPASLTQSEFYRSGPSSAHTRALET